VEAARQIQRQRFQQGGQAAAGILCNADMHTADLRAYCALDETCQNLMRAAMTQMHLSARGYHRILKLARTIADLDHAENIRDNHLAEALQYRPQILI
jgi:magnesium chelatase family protein